VIEEQIDILIVGGGLTGATLMLALADHGFKVRLIDAKPLCDRVQPEFDARTLALSPASVRILERLALWPLLKADATPIDAIHVSERYRFGTAYLQKDQDESLGYVLEMQHISSALLQLLDSDKILAPAELRALDVDSGTATLHYEGKDQRVQAKLIVAADGSWSSVRRMAGLRVDSKAYNQQAIVANIGLNRPHANIAYERFTAAGPLAMLPMTSQRAALIWALQPAEATRLMALNDKAFLAELQIAFGYRLGRLIKVGKRSTWPLQQLIMPQQVAWPLVFVGNAAHTLHPVAGQGFNLGLRDVAMLAQCLIETGLNPGTLARYQAARRYDQAAIIRLTDGLVSTFSNAFPGLGLLRSLGLAAADQVPVLKRMLSRHARGFAGVVPDLACGIDLKPGRHDDKAV